jgi:hypothetical protein
MRILVLTELFLNSIMLARAIDGPPLDWYLLEQRIKREPTHRVVAPLGFAASRT